MCVHYVAVLAFVVAFTKIAVNAISFLSSVVELVTSYRNRVAVFKLAKV